MIKRALFALVFLSSQASEAKWSEFLLPLNENTFIADTRENVGEARRIQQLYAHTNVRILETKTTEFGNGNTFVRFESPVLGRNVIIALPQRFSADTLMEVLLKIHTAKTWGARAIEIASPAMTSLSDLKLSPTELVNMLRVAGATHLNLGNWQAARTLRSWPRTLSQVVVLSLGHPELGAQLATAWGLRHQDLAMEGELPENHRVIFLSMIASPTNKNFFETMKVASQLKGRGNEVFQIFPYLPYVRSDKIDQPGVTVGGRLIADLIQSTGVDFVGLIKLHSLQVQGFFSSPSLHIETRSTISRYLKELKVDAVVSPDAGFQKEASRYADTMSLPVYVLNKQRNPETGVPELQKMGDFNVQGKILAVVDDETASGSTLVAAAEFLKSQGAAKVYAFVTHLAGGAERVIGNRLLDALYVTDTFPVPSRLLDQGVHVMPVVSEIVDVLDPFLGLSCESALRGPE